MGAGSWIARGWEVYVSHWKGLALGAVVLFVLYVVLMALGGGTAYILPFLNGGPGETSWSSIEQLPGWVIAVIVILNFTVGVMLHLGYKYYVLKAVRQQELDFIDILFPFKRPLGVIGVALLFYLAIMASAVPGIIALLVLGALGIAGIMLAVAILLFLVLSVSAGLFFGDIALIDRELSALEALGESWFVTKGHRFAVLLVLVFFVIVGGVLDGIAGLFDDSLTAVVVLSLVQYLLILPWSYATFMCAYDELVAETRSE